jgi:hypothetical protein
MLAVFGACAMMGGGSLNAATALSFSTTDRQKTALFFALIAERRCAAN